MRARVWLAVLWVGAAAGALFGYSEVVAGGSSSGRIVFYLFSVLCVCRSSFWRPGPKGGSGDSFWMTAAMLLWSLLPAVYLLVSWQWIAERVVSHFDAMSRPDRDMARWELWVPCGVLTIGSGLSLLSRGRAGRVAAFLITVLNALVILSALCGVRLVDRVMFPAICIVLAFGDRVDLWCGVVLLVAGLIVPLPHILVPLSFWLLVMLVRIATFKSG